MSRVPPFPQARRPQTPIANEYDHAPASPNTTRPLVINRPPNRPNTPGSRVPSGGATPSTPNGPTRPARSGLRTRQMSEHSISIDLRDSRDYGRDSVGTTRSDISVPPPRPSRIANSSTSNNMNNWSGATSMLSPISPGTESEISPSSAVALAAFQGLMARRRGMSEDDLMEEEYSKQRDREIALMKDQQKKIRDRIPGRQQTKPRVGDIDAVVEEIREEWEVVTNPDFNPVDLALQLLDDSSSTKDMESFRQTKDMLSKALKGSVDKHYQAFAAALPHHASLLNRLGGISNHITDARAALKEAKDSLVNKRGDLVQLWSRSQTVEEMLRILDQIEHLRSVPDILESLISEKRLLQAAILLVRSLKMINKQDMQDIGALSDLRSYLSSQETALRDILIDEVHSHLYLKSFWCDSRWAAYVPNQQTLPVVEFEEIFTTDLTKAPSSPTSPTSRSTRLSRYLDNLNLRSNEPPFDVNEHNFRNNISGSNLQASSSISRGLSTMQSSSSNANFAAPLMNFATSTAPAQQSSNPEADSFSYIETLLEALAVLGKLAHALDIITQKLPQEVFALVETTLDEVSERAEYGQRRSALGPALGTGRLDDVYVLTTTGASESLIDPNVIGGTVVPTIAGTVSAGNRASLKATALRLATLELSTKRADQEIMQDLFWTLYSKLDAVAQGLRVVYEVANRIGLRRDYKDASGTKLGSLFPLAELWAPVQGEVRTLLNDYITDEEQGTVTGRNPIASINEVLREGKYLRDRTKPVFRFADTDLKLAAKSLREHEDELTRALKDTVPGLVQGSAESAVQATLTAVGTDDRLLGTGNHHRLLVHPDAFHVTVLFQPTLSFLERIAEVLPSEQEARQVSSELLDDFVLKVYLPQLEDKVSMLFHQAVTSPDAFQPESASTNLSSRPLIKASVHLMALINSLCSMLRTTPFHRENYARLILTVIVQFYQHCSDKFQELVSLRNPQDPEALPRVALAAQWAQRPELTTCLAELLSISGGEIEFAKKRQLCKQECNLEYSLLGSRSVLKEELIASTRNLSTLASLYHSVTWFAAELNSLKSTPEGPLSPTTPLRLEPLTAVTPYTPYAPTAPHVNDQLKLPLSSAMALRFQALQKTYEQLSESILYSIRVDIRCRVMHRLSLALCHGNYEIEREASEPDPHIIDLNIELGTCDDFAGATLPKRERQFVFEGISYLMENLLISNARHIRAVNANGAKKLLRNVLALQQNMRTIVQESHHTHFDRIKQYYSLLQVTPQTLLESIQKKQEFTFDEYKVILDLLCGVDPSQTEQGAAQAKDRNYNMYVIELHGLELENSSES